MKFIVNINYRLRPTEEYAGIDTSRMLKDEWLPKWETAIEKFKPEFNKKKEKLKKIAEKFELPYEECDDQLLIIKEINVGNDAEMKPLVKAFEKVKDWMGISVHIYEEYMVHRELIK